MKEEKEEVVVGLLGSKRGREVRVVDLGWCGEERGERDGGVGESECI